MLAPLSYTMVPRLLIFCAPLTYLGETQASRKTPLNGMPLSIPQSRGTMPPLHCAQIGLATIAIPGADGDKMPFLVGPLEALFAEVAAAAGAGDAQVVTHVG